MRRLGLVAIAALVVTLSAVRQSARLDRRPDRHRARRGDADRRVCRQGRRGEDRPHERRGHRRPSTARTRTLPLDGALDFGTGAFEFSYDMSQLGLPGAGDAKIEARMVDGAMYMKLGDLGGDGVQPRS